jgi:peptidoglycan/xylan/chitin deacetylase (PgdA/CDA1 family)
MPGEERVVYLTFDDGPHPHITPWVLDLLKEYDALATFFCIGNNVQQFSQVYQRLLNENHAVGNHTYHHLNGWKTSDEKYIADVRNCAQLVPTNLFRPPYGRIRSGQAREIPDAMATSDAKIIMWDVLSADFDTSLSQEQCLKNVIENIEPGSVIVFHDSQKAYQNLQYVLPRTLKYLRKEGYKCRKIEL